MLREKERLAYEGWVVWLNLRQNGQPRGGAEDYSKVHYTKAGSDRTVCGSVVPQWAYTGTESNLGRYNINCRGCEKKKAKAENVTN